MNIGHVPGAGGVKPTPNRTETPNRAESPELAGRETDQASISSESKEAFAIVSELTKSVKETPSVRQDRVEEARHRLESGELDSQEAYRATAERLLDEV